MFADIGTDHPMAARLSPGRFKYLLRFAFPFLMHREKDMIMGSPQDHYKIGFSGLTNLTTQAAEKSRSFEREPLKVVPKSCAERVRL